LCDLFDNGYSSSFDDIMDSYSGGDNFPTVKACDGGPKKPTSQAPPKDDFFNDEEDDEPAPPPPPKKKKSPKKADPAADAPISADQLVPLGIYGLSGILLIFMMEQFVQVGMRMRQF
jgi:hypothetical protein